MVRIVNMCLEKVFNLGYPGSSHDQLLYLVGCGQRRMSVSALVRHACAVDTRERNSE